MISGQEDWQVLPFITDKIDTDCINAIEYRKKIGFEFYKLIIQNKTKMCRICHMTLKQYKECYNVVTEGLR